MVHTRLPAAHGTPDAHPVAVTIVPALTARHRLTCACRLALGIPHIILVGAVLGPTAVLAAILGWFTLLVGGDYPLALWRLGAFYLRRRVRAVAYLALLRDEYPPFGDGAYPVALLLKAPRAPRDRLGIILRIILVLPHLAILWVLGIAWATTTVVAWYAILLTGNYPATLYGFALDVFRWSTRVEAYLLLLCDQYPPFSFDAR